MDDIKPSITTPDCPPPSVYEKTEKLSEKYYNIKHKENEYDLIITLYENKQNNSEKIFNFTLLKPEGTLNKYYSYESEKSTSELIKLFLLNTSENTEKKIFERIEKFHLNNNVEIIDNKNYDNIIDLIYILKTYDNEDIKFTIELIKTGNVINKEKNKDELIKEIQDLKNTIKKMEKEYDKIIKKQNEEIRSLKEKIKEIMNNSSYNNNAKIIDEEKQLIFKSDISVLNSMKLINADIDGGRGLNDYFEPFYLKDDKNTAYIAVKCKEEGSDISYIDIYKMTSINNIKKIKRLSGHQKRIVFVKYFKNPYTLQEYLITGDREEIVRTWEIIDESNYLLLNVIVTKYGRLLMQQSIYNCLLYFTNKRSYVYTTTVTYNYSRFYDLENGAFIKDISITYYNYTLYLLRYKDYIIDCCRNYILIYNPLNEEIYSKIENSYTKGDNRSACIIYDKKGTDYLYISNSNGYVNVFDLKAKEVHYNFDLSQDLYHIIFWDLNHLIVAQYDSEFLGIIDIDNMKKNVIKCNKSLMCVKKIKINNTEEILLASGENSGDIYILFSSNTPESSQIKKIS